MAGYSSKSLTEKLGLSPTLSAHIINAPPDYLKPAKFSSSLNVNTDFVQFFTTSKDDLTVSFPLLKSALKTTGTLWISWPKQSAKKDTDLNENIIREIGLANGMVDVKVIAIDEVWSGLKFVFRLKDR